nr:hypothetical protein [Candidatus Woesearchaeota archaeon]
MKQDEHKVIIEKILLLFAQFGKLPRTIQNKDVTYSEHGEYISWINHQITTLKDAYSLLSTNSYKSVFSLIRVVFEAYWVIDLSMNGPKFYLNYSPKEGHDIQKIYQVWVKDFESNKENKIKQGILEIKHPIKNKIMVVYEGRKNQEGKIIQNYYFLFKEYDHEIAHLGLEEDYYESEELGKINEELIKKHKGFKWYFKFNGGIKDNLLLNKLINEEEFERARVHYSFLSMWTHPSMNSIRLIEKNIYGRGEFEDIKKYDFFLTRLALLYIGNTMCLYLNSFLKFARRQIFESKITSIKDEKDFINSVKAYLENTNYFWFIYNEPHYYYKWKYASKLLGKQDIEEIKKLKISDMTASEIEYYKNPIKTLKNLSTSWNNEIIGKYESPIEAELKSKPSS